VWVVGGDSGGDGVRKTSESRSRLYGLGWFLEKFGVVGWGIVLVVAFGV
jgi:hypothetical protein